MCFCILYNLQALAKKWTGLGIPVRYEYILEKAYAIAHLPANKIAEGIDHLRVLVEVVWRRNEPDKQKLHDFRMYITTYWEPLAEVLSVFQKPVKTNNTCENFHMVAYKTIGAKLIIWKLFGMKIINNILYKF